MHRFAVPYLCLGALPLLYPAAPPSVFAFGKYTAPAVALVREYVEYPSVDFLSPVHSRRRGGARNGIQSDAISGGDGADITVCCLPFSGAR